LKEKGHQVIAFFLSFFAYAGPTCMSTGCHAAMKSTPFVHAPIKAASSCVICHKVKAEGGRHPKLVSIDKAKINQVCLACHDNLLLAKKHGSKIFKHSAIEQETCLGCHDPHGSKHQHLTKEDSKMALCLTCHKDMASQQKNAVHHKIGAMAKGCLSCHNAHVADNARLLVKSSPAQVCLSCHDKEIHTKERVIASAANFTAGHVHAPVAKGECSKCHTVHGSPNHALLAKTYSPNLYESYSSNNYELCFQCHKERLAETRMTTSETSFRNGDLNLHALHLATQKKQRTCRACHDVHSSQQAKLIRQSFVYQDYQLPIQFTISEKGGTCATACHHEMTYNREKAFKNER
jgi:predicted CXXCH cytochrome family protein